jgi:hypothetical protein
VLIAKIGLPQVQALNADPARPVWRWLLSQTPSMRKLGMGNVTRCLNNEDFVADIRQLTTGGFSWQRPSELTLRVLIAADLHVVLFSPSSRLHQRNSCSCSSYWLTLFGKLGADIFCIPM